VKVEAAIFDWDGTLVDLDERELHCINKALANCVSRTISKQDYIEGYYSNPYIEVGARSFLRRILGDTETAEKAIEIYSDEFLNTPHLIKLQEKAFNVLKTLKLEGLSLAVTTLRRRRMPIEQEIQYLNIDGFIKVLVTREDIELKPLAKPILSIIAELRTQQFMKTLTLLQKVPSKTIILGDSWWDLRAAKRVGAISAWVKTGFGAYNDFSIEKPDISLNNLEELLNHV
jgi:pyrophosphatase PpaX